MAKSALDANANVTEDTADVIAGAMVRMLWVRTGRSRAVDSIMAVAPMLLV